MALQASQQLSLATTWAYPTYHWTYKWTLWLKQVIAQWKLVCNTHATAKPQFPLPQAQFMDASHGHIVACLKSDAVPLDILAAHLNHLIWYYIAYSPKRHELALLFWQGLQTFSIYLHRAENVQCIPKLQLFMFDTLSMIFTPKE